MATDMYGNELHVGSKVTTTATTTYDGNVTLASFVRTTTYDVIQIGGSNLPEDRIVIGLGSAVTAAVKAETIALLGATPTPVDVSQQEEYVVDEPPRQEEVIPNNTPVETNTTPQKTNQEILNSVFGNMKGAIESLGVTTVNGANVQFATGDKLLDAMTNEVENVIDMITRKKDEEQQMSEAESKLNKKDPSIIQNAYNFPKNIGFNSTKGYYEYNYYMDYEEDSAFKPNLDVIAKGINQDIRGRRALYRQYVNYYNKYKIGNPNDSLAKSFGHVFFIKPDCHIFRDFTDDNQKARDLNAANVGVLTPEILALSEYYYAYYHCPELLWQLNQTRNPEKHDFMLYLSNKAETFEVKDEYIGIDAYGQGLTGYKIPIGLNDVESKGNDKFTIKYHDDRDLHIYHQHKLWMDYISHVYRGKLSPTIENIMNKIIDYATCVYYILTAEDGETIIFWSKYWGVFPVESPSSSFSFNKDNAGGVSNPELGIQYQYAWKEDFNPLSLLEFNTHSYNVNSLKYIKSYQNAKAGTGYTWSGVPFIETYSDTSADVPYSFKLKFRPYE